MGTKYKSWVEENYGVGTGSKKSCQLHLEHSECAMHGFTDLYEGIKH